MAWRAEALLSQKATESHKTSVSRLIGFVSSCLEEVVAFFVGEEVAHMADGLPEFWVGSDSSLSDQRLELREGHFDRVQVGAVGRQEQEPRADIAHGFGRTGALVARQVVEDDHVAGTQGWHQLGLDIEVEHIPIHRSVDHPGPVQSVVPQGTDERLRSPMSERSVIDQALPARGPAGGLGHVGLSDVSSMNANLSRWRAMKGWRLPTQMRRRSATSWRFCSSACRSFFV